MNLLFLQWHGWYQKSDSNLLKINKESYKDIGIYNIGYIKLKKLMIMKIL